LALFALFLCLGSADDFEQLERAWVILLTASLAIVLITARPRGTSRRRSSRWRARAAPRGS